jgi:hypothetical protein
MDKSFSTTMAPNAARETSRLKQNRWEHSLRHLIFHLWVPLGLAHRCQPWRLGYWNRRYGLVFSGVSAHPRGKMRKYVRSFVVDGVVEHLGVEMWNDLSNRNNGCAWTMQRAFVVNSRLGCGVADAGRDGLRERRLGNDPMRIDPKPW